jgi:hypothetical protein
MHNLPTWYHLVHILALYPLPNIDIELLLTIIVGRRYRTFICFVLVDAHHFHYFYNSFQTTFYDARTNVFKYIYHLFTIDRDHHSKH